MTNRMGTATEEILRWHVLRRGLPESEADGLLAAVARGLEAGEVDSARAVEGWVAEAHASWKASPDAALPYRLFQIHVEIRERLRVDDQLGRIAKVLETEPRSPLAARVQQQKVRAIANEGS